MRLDYTYKATSVITHLLEELEILKRLIDVMPKLPQVEENLRRTSLLKSSLFSARIEGNSLTLVEIGSLERRKPEGVKKLEVWNILQTKKWLLSKEAPKEVSIALLKEMHRMVLSDLSADAGSLRIEPSAIFNEAGVAVYMPPPPSQLHDLINQLVILGNNTANPSPVNGAICHVAFEKIHPFLDGNGRVGRLLSLFLLDKGGFGYRGLLTFEEYLENHRQAYYDLLASPEKDLTPFVEFFLQGLQEQAAKAVTSLSQKKEETFEDSLLPRRAEILSIIRDHGVVSFDFVRRRFLAVTASTLHFDIAYLLKHHFIRKLGRTRGVQYEAI